MNIKPNYEAERACVGCVLLDPSTYAGISQYIDHTDFIDEHIRDYWYAIELLDKEGSPKDVVTLAVKLKEKGLYLDPDDLIEMQSEVPIATHYEQYAKLVLEASKKKKLIESVGSIESIIDGSETSDEALTKTLELINSINKDVSKDVSISDQLEAYRQEQLDEYSGFETGLELLDNKLKGIKAGLLYTLNAPSGCGKTTLALQIMRNLCRQNAKVSFFSLEMPAVRIISMLERVCRFYGENVEVIKDWNLKIHENIYSWRNIKNKVLAMQDKPDVVFIDFAQLVRVEGKDIFNRMYNLSRDVQEFKNKHGVTFVILSQVSTESIKSNNKHASPKGGNDLYEVSDVFLNITRKREEEESVKQDSNKPGFSQDTLTRYLSISKSRTGAEGGIKVYYYWKDGYGLYDGFGVKKEKLDF